MKRNSDSRKREGRVIQVSEGELKSMERPSFGRVWKKHAP